MLPLRDQTRRALCRAAFLALCLVPTLAVAGWCCYWNAASTRTTLTAEFTRQLGLRVTAARITYPRPGLLLCEDVQLFEPETGQSLMRMRLLEIGSSGNATVLIASQPEIEAAQLGRLNQIVERALRQLPDSGLTDLRVLASELTLNWPGASRTFTDVRGQIESQPGASEAVLTFHVAGLDMPEAARIRLFRNRQAAPPTMGFELHTGDTPLPCSLLIAPLSIKNRLGERAHFQGSIWASETTDGWQGTCAGRLTGVDLRSLVTEQFPLHLTGSADITVKEARFQKGRLEQGVGSIQAGPGVVGRSFLEAAAQWLHLSATNIDLALGDLLRYDQLALAFVVEADGLSLQGQCTGASPGTVLTGPSQRAAHARPTGRAAAGGESGASAGAAKRGGCACHARNRLAQWPVAAATVRGPRRRTASRAARSSA